MQTLHGLVQVILNLLGLVLGIQAEFLETLKSILEIAVRHGFLALGPQFCSAGSLGKRPRNKEERARESTTDPDQNISLHGKLPWARNRECTVENDPHGRRSQEIVSPSG